MFNQDSKKDKRQEREKSRQQAILQGTSVVGGMAAVTTLVLLIPKVIADISCKILSETGKFVKKSTKDQTYEILSDLDIDGKIVINQAYEVSSNSDIDKKIRKKTEEIESLKKMLDKKTKEMKSLKKSLKSNKKKRLEDICNHLSLQIQNKSYCLDFLKKQKEQQESISQNISKRNQLLSEKENTSFLHPKKKKKIANEITECENSVEIDYKEYSALEHKISETEKEEEILAGEYKKFMTGKGVKILITAFVIIGICLICGIIALFGA